MINSAETSHSFIFASVLFVLAAFALPGCSEDPTGQPKATSEKAAPKSTDGEAGQIVAKVDGQAIYESDLDYAEAEIGGNLGTLNSETKRRVLVEYLVENQLFANAAQSENLASGPDFDRRLSYWRQRALREAYFEEKVKGGIGDAAAKALYDDKVKMIKPEEEVQARHILVAKKEDADKLVKEIRDGGDFAALAKQHSGDGGSKDKGGMLGFFGRGQMVPQFEQAAFALKKGEVSDPVESQFGWHIIKVEDRRQKPPPKFEDVKSQIMGTLIHKRAQKVAEDLRKSAKIEYLDPKIKEMVEADEKRKAATQAALEKQMREQIEKMQADKVKKDGAEKSDASADKPTSAPAPQPESSTSPSP